MFDFSELNKKTSEVEEWLKKEFSGIRTGRANTSILDNITVDVYGSKMAIKELANITISDAKSLKISPWDAVIGKDIEKAIVSSGSGLSVVTDDSGLRVIFPDLTSERREALIKMAKQKLEESRISLRGLRDKIWEDIQKKEKEKEISKDDKFRLKDKMQEIIDNMNKRIEEDYKRKENEISS